MRAQFATLLALAAPLYAIKITSPSKNDVVDPSKGVTVKWSTVNTDPSKAHLVLVNMASGHIPFSKDLGEVDLSTGSFKVSEKDVPSDEGFQFNFESTETQNTGILAQSEQFEVKSSASDSDDDEEKSSSSASASASASTSATASASSSSVTLTTTIRTLTQTFTSTGSDTTVTGTTVTTSTGTPTGNSGTQTESATSSTSEGAAAPTGMVVQGGSLLALVAGVAAVLA
ncbi:Ser-Thr-rich glycosyl-phosphatidyl-inositol-anchored membrane family-domain-containing protein [Chaetomium tenue]|uniref:Ser-Thr-rich glycosyl-phosphatidyl-inositol-anchored membrane family-domain-containing protein n=1 Tax=Chaetomium tenue TaxID=1854479 RepID=A0ACB7P2I9_9PEZI|nr:Ser-Thr-rich glycosyl-phosphatidyl-inositol-anchored membrane family-domain-containing protein [Chaetomium globosum]